MGDIADYHRDRFFDLDDEYMSTQKEPVTISFIRLVHETPSAWLLLLDEGETVFDESAQEWFPKSQCSLDEEAKKITLPEWLAIEKDLI